MEEKILANAIIMAALMFQKKMTLKFTQLLFVIAMTFMPTEEVFSAVAELQGSARAPINFSVNLPERPWFDSYANCLEAAFKNGLTAGKDPQYQAVGQLWLERGPTWLDWPWGKKSVGSLGSCVLIGDPENPSNCAILTAAHVVDSYESGWVEAALAKIGLEDRKANIFVTFGDNYKKGYYLDNVALFKHKNEHSGALVDLALCQLKAAPIDIEPARLSSTPLKHGERAMLRCAGYGQFLQPLGGDYVLDGLYGQQFVNNFWDVPRRHVTAQEYTHKDVRMPLKSTYPLATLSAPPNLYDMHLSEDGLNIPVRPLTMGFSGGPLFNNAGEIVGVAIAGERYEAFVEDSPEAAVIREGLEPFWGSYHRNSDLVCAADSLGVYLAPFIPEIYEKLREWGPPPKSEGVRIRARLGFLRMILGAIEDKYYIPGFKTFRWLYDL